MQRSSCTGSYIHVPMHISVHESHLSEQTGLLPCWRSVRFSPVTPSMWLQYTVVHAGCTAFCELFHQFFMNLNILIRLRTIEKTERRHVPADSRTRVSDGFIAGNLCLSECMITYERKRTLLSRHFKSAYTGKTRRKQHSTFHRVTYRYLRPTLKAGGIMIDQEKTGRFIADLRKEKKL